MAEPPEPAGGSTGSDGEDERAGEAGSPYRGAGSDYDGQIYSRSYRTPGRINLKKAMREYVRGHDRGWDQQTKSRMADRELEDEESEKGYLGPGQAVASGDLTLRERGEASAGSAEGAEAVDRPRVGVGVPEKLVFHRGPDTWRDRVRELIHGAVQEPPGDERG